MSGMSPLNNSSMSSLSTSFAQNPGSSSSSSSSSSGSSLVSSLSRSGSSSTRLGLRKPDHKDSVSLVLKDSIQELSLSKRVADVLIPTMKAICASYMYKKQSYLEKPSVLNCGLFYQNFYCTALEEVSKNTASERVKTVVDKRYKTFTKRHYFYHGLAPKQFLEGVPNKQFLTGWEILHYRIKKGILPSKVLEGILKEECLIFLSCTEVIEIAYYKALLDVLGTEKFDHLFAANTSTRFTLSENSQHRHPLSILVKETQKLTQGCWVYFTNTTQYSQKHINGDCNGFNVLYTTDHANQPLYLGFGLESEGVNKDKLNATLLSEYNMDQSADKGLTSKLYKKILASYHVKQLQQTEQLEKHQMTPQEYRKTGGGQIKKIVILDKNIVKQLIKLSKEEGRAFLAKRLEQK